MLKASNLKAQGFSLGFGVCNPLRAESTPEGLSCGSVSPTGKVHHVQFDRLLENSETRPERVALDVARPDFRYRRILD